jgi:SAM-dependent methyltransferase
MIDQTDYIPPLSLNYNWGDSDKNLYERDFANPYSKIILPLAIDQIENEEIIIGQRLPKILDIGCGFAPLALGYKIFLEKLNSLTLFKNTKCEPDEILYLGIDIRFDAIDWLKKAYSADNKFVFYHHEANQSLDYVGDFESDKKVNKTATSAKSNGNECHFSLPVPYISDFQWSSSVFTHLTPQAVINALQFIYSSLAPGGVSINTWLIADTQSCLAMSTGKADRKLEIDKGEFLTYSEKNPLLCTAYKLDFIKKSYRRAGLQIQSIEKGSWRGSGLENQYDHYQDVIVARRLNKY